jgi:hypothetical protein
MNDEKVLEQVTVFIMRANLAPIEFLGQGRIGEGGGLMTF